VGAPCPARAADTVETWDVGATDVEFYSGMNGVGLKRAQGSLFGDLMLGYGLVERLSAYVGQRLTGNKFFTGGTGTTYLGLFGTAVDTRHFDLDLFLGFDLGGPGYRELGVTPMVELNFDVDPNRHSWGAYVRVGLRLHGQNATGDDVHPRWETYTTLCAVLGTYYNIARRHQLLLEGDVAWRPLRAPGERELELGGIALGYNVILNDRIELINQVYIDIPHPGSPGEKLSVGFMAGFIVTLPSLKK
jgi:hypothetical protein